MKTYEEYKPSGSGWLGDSPTKWNVKKLKYLVTLVDEAPDSDDFLIAVENIESKMGKLVGLDEEMTYEGNPKGFKRGDVLFNKLRPYLAKVWFAERDGAYIGELLNFRNGDEIDGKFLYYRTISAEFIDVVDSSTNGTKMPRANWDGFISQLRIPYPSINEQTAIADYLDKETARIDEVVGKKKRLIELLKEERLAIINHAVTRGLDPNAKLKPSNIEWLGDIPKKWDVRRLKYLVSVKARLGWRGLKADEYVREGYGFLSTPNIKYNEIDFENINFITEERYFESPEIMLQIGDVVLAKDGSTLGIVNVVTDLPFPTTVNSSIAVLRVDDENIVFPPYLKYFLESRLMQSVIQWIKGGMGVPHLFQEDIREFNLLIPPISDQREIANYVRAETGKIERVIAKIEKEIGLLNEYRTALISEVVTGKVKVV